MHRNSGRERERKQNREKEGETERSQLTNVHKVLTTTNKK